MVAIDKAIESSKLVLSKVMPDYASLNPDVDEFRLSEEGDKWIITFSAKKPQSSEAPEADFYAPYIVKVAIVSADNGELLSVRNPSF